MLGHAPLLPTPMVNELCLEMTKHTTSSFLIYIHLGGGWQQIWPSRENPYMLQWTGLKGGLTIMGVLIVQITSTILTDAWMLALETCQSQQISTSHTATVCLPQFLLHACCLSPRQQHISQLSSSGTLKSDLYLCLSCWQDCRPNAEWMANQFLRGVERNTKR